MLIHCQVIHESEAWFRYSPLYGAGSVDFNVLVVFDILARNPAAHIFIDISKYSHLHDVPFEMIKTL